jgi:serine/threonine protein kinase
MKKGDDVRGYLIVSEPTNSGGGRCVWAFAQNSAGRYFIKQFLDPKWPTSSSMGSAASKDARRRECMAFEHRHRDVNSRLNPVGAGGNLVGAIDFFREDTTYYKVTERVDASSLERLEGLSLRQITVVLRTLCQSIRQLHRAGIVHGDLKPANVLLHRPPAGNLYMAKVIDFDDAYLAGDPPPPDQIVGDQRFGAPEWLSYVKREDEVGRHQLTVKADVFALALLLHVYLTGDLPGHDQARFGAPADAVRAKEPLRVHPALHPRMRELLGRMTELRPEDRPSVEEVLQTLDEPGIAHTTYPTRKLDRAGPKPPDPLRLPRRSGRIHYNFDR